MGESNTTSKEKGAKKTGGMWTGPSAGYRICKGESVKWGGTSNIRDAWKATIANSSATGEVRGQGGGAKNGGWTDSRGVNRGVGADRGFETSGEVRLAGRVDLIRGVRLDRAFNLDRGVGLACEVRSDGESGQLEELT